MYRPQGPRNQQEQMLEGRPCCCFGVFLFRFFFLFLNFTFYFWLCWVFVAGCRFSLVAVRSLLIVVASRCGAWALGAHQLLWHVGSEVVARGL